MALLPFMLLILASACMTVQAQNNQSACNQTTSQSASVESTKLVKELESDAMDGLKSKADEFTSSVMSMIKTEQERIGKVKTAMAEVKADLTCDMTIKSIVQELKAELSKGHSMTVSKLTEMLRKQEKLTEDLASDMRALRKGLSERLENTERKIDWAITDGNLVPRNASCFMESFSRLEQRLDGIDRKLNQCREEPGKTGQKNIKYRDCAEVYNQGERTNGVYTIYPYGRLGVSLKVYCDMTTDGGGWTVFQKRFSGEVDFFRGWEEYAEGFGDSEKEYWLGLKHIHEITITQPNELYVGVTDFDLGEKHAKYGTFKVSSEADKFRLAIGSYTGNAGDSLKYHNGQKFSTKDQDNDQHSGNCSIDRHGAWWYKSCNWSNLNGQFSATMATGSTHMIWYYLKRKLQSMKSSVMMMRPANFKP